MIELKVEDKCQDCPYFNPKLEVIDVTTLGEEIKLAQTVYCDRNDFCKNLENHLEKTIKK